MAENDNYKVLVPELTVPRSIGELQDIYGNVIGHSHVGVTHYEGDVLSADEVSPVVQEAVDRGELDGRLEKVSDEPTQNLEARLRPFAGYDELDVDQIRSLMLNLPSEAIQQVKAYEAEYGENRPEIVLYDVGRGESFTDRVTGNIGSDLDDPAEKDTADIVTREVSEDEVQFGQGIIGDGQPDVEPGSDTSVRVGSEAVVEDKDESPFARRRSRRVEGEDEADSNPEGDGSTPVVTPGDGGSATTPPEASTSNDS